VVENQLNINFETHSRSGVIQLHGHHYATSPGCVSFLFGGVNGVP